MGAVFLVVSRPLALIFEYSAPVEHLRPAKLNTCVAENEQCRRSSCTLTSPNLYDTINILYSQGG